MLQRSFRAAVLGGVTAATGVMCTARSKARRKNKFPWPVRNRDDLDVEKAFCLRAQLDRRGPARRGGSERIGRWCAQVPVGTVFPSACPSAVVAGGTLKRVLRSPAPAKKLVNPQSLVVGFGFEERYAWGAGVTTAVLLLVLETAVRVLSGIAWRFVEYSKGVWAALLVVTTATLGIIEVLARIP